MYKTAKERIGTKSAIDQLLEHVEPDGNGFASQSSANGLPLIAEELLDDFAVDAYQSDEEVANKDEEVAYFRSIVSSAEWLQSRDTSEEQKSHFQVDNFLKSRVYKSGNRIPNPIESLDQATQFVTKYRQHLVSLHITKPTQIQTLMWPSILKGRSVSCVSGIGTGKSAGYLIPLLNSLSKQYLDDTDSVSSSPPYIVICSTAKVVRKVYDLAKRLSLIKTIKINLLESSVITSQTEKMLSNGSDILIATPPALAKALSEQLIVLDSCILLAFDDADKAMLLHIEETKKIVLEYMAVAKSRLPKNTPSKNALVVQIVMCAEKYTKLVRDFIQTQHNPVTLIGDFMEAVVCGGIECHFQFCSSDVKRIRGLCEVMQKAKNFSSRVVVCCQSEKECAVIKKNLKQCEGQFVTKELTGATPHYDHQPILKFWRNGSGSKDATLVLILSDDADHLMSQLTDVTCLVHYDMPPSKADFSRRFQVVADRLQDVNTHQFCFFVLTPENSQEAEGIATFVQRLGQRVPGELSELSRQHDRPLCEMYAITGACSLNPLYCSKKHIISKTPPKDAIGENRPREGTQIKFIVTHVVSASEFYVRLIAFRDENQDYGKWQNFPLTFDHLKQKLSELDKKTAIGSVDVKSVCVGKMYAVSMLGFIHRVRVQKVTKELLEHYQESSTISIKVFHVDFGYSTRVTLADLIPLSPDVIAVPEFAMKAFLVGVKPQDGDVSWSLSSTHFVESVVRSDSNLFLTGWVVLQLNNLLWLDTVKVNQHLPSMKIEVVNVNLAADLIKRKLAAEAPVCLPFLSPVQKEEVMLKWKVDLHKKWSQYAFIPEDTMEYVYLTHYEMPRKLFLRIARYKDLLEELEKAIALEKLLPLKSFKKGLLCLARCELDNSLNRAIISKLRGEETVDVFYLDHGEEFKIDRKDCFEISQQLIKQLPFQAIHCSLYKFVGGQTGAEDYVYDVTRNEDNSLEELMVQRVSREKGVTMVRLYKKVSEDSEWRNYTSFGKFLMDKDYGFLVDEEEHNEIKLKKRITGKDDSDEELPEREKVFEDNFQREIDDYITKCTVAIQRTFGINDTTTLGKTCKGQAVANGTVEKECGQKSMPPAIGPEYVPFDKSVPIDRGEVLPYDPIDDEDRYKDGEESDEEIFDAADKAYI